MSVNSETGPQVAGSHQERGEIAKRRMIDAGLKVFGELGYEGASTRLLTSVAGVNIAALTYYFGSKEGLYLAVIDHIIEHYKGSLGDELARVRRALARPGATDEDFRALLDEHLRIIIRLMFGKAHTHPNILQIHIREQLDPTAGFERLYQGFTREMQETLELLVAAILGFDPKSVELKLIAKSLFGQIVIFKSSRAAVLRNVGWETYDDNALKEIERVILFQADAVISAYLKRGRAS